MWTAERATSLAYYHLFFSTQAFFINLTLKLGLEILPQIVMRTRKKKGPSQFLSLLPSSSEYLSFLCFSSLPWKRVY